MIQTLFSHHHLNLHIYSVSSNVKHQPVSSRHVNILEMCKCSSRAEKSTYLTTVRLDPSLNILNLRANFQRNQMFSYFLRAVTSLFHDIRTGNCMYNHIGYKESCICNDQALFLLLNLGSLKSCTKSSEPISKIFQPCVHPSTEKCNQKDQ